MPIYEYNCPDCGEDFETLVLNPDEKVRCPKCESEKVKRRMSCFSMSGGDLGASPKGGCAPSGGFS